MENVYAPENFSATEPLDLTKYFEDYQAESKLHKLEFNNKIEERLQYLKEDFKLPFGLDEVKALEELCTIDKLKLSKETSKLPLKTIPKNHEISVTYPITEEGKELETVKCKEYFNLMKNDMHMDLKALGLGLQNSEDDLNCIKDLQPGSTFIMIVLIHIPFNTMSGNRLTPDSIRVQYEMEVLGTNTLFELANAINCVSDVFIVKEVENTQVDLSNLHNAKEKYPSRCFFIENVFYNDMSHPNSVDYSAVIRKWAIENKIGEFRSESMEGVTFDSLKPRLGFGYVYIHQGNCEHIVSFSDVKLIQNSDCLVSKRYPRIVSLKRQTNFICFICSQNHSSWMVVNSDRLPVKKAFFCTKCCESYMFLDGKKIGKFQLYPYYNTVLPETSQEDGLAHEELHLNYMDEQ